ncbi:alpha/beta hydrolase [Paenibacillus mesophilus]|uniref:alpha/beta fold hydrolase n=1 Tax=Paenibacillus mesophilus TaxID=2582849 RepID=UPI00110DECD7|nr:alpha/beta hydrolase [Paenibacillus mesophilus]TMV47018.1 alpha/beta hydrolase [Paenibacillus mesophilus]
MEKVHVNGVNICYESTGEGYPLIAIMGKDSNMDWWNPSIKAALSERNRLIMLDNRGTGRSDVPEVAYGIADMAKDVVGLMDALGIDKAHIFGQSMGGMIAQEIAIEYPERVAKLILCCTTCGVTRVLPTWRMVMRLMRKKTGFSAQSTLNMLYSKEYMKQNPEQIRAFVERVRNAPPDPRTVDMHKRASRAFDSYERLGRITAPTLIVHGEKDWVFTPKHAKLLNGRIAGSKLVLFPDAGHGLFTQEYRKIIEEIHRFIG